MQQAQGTEIIHASAVSLGSTGILLTGASGSGKSTIALEMMALGASLVADDRVVAQPSGEGVLISAPPEIAGRIEARGLGLLQGEPVNARLAAVVDLDQVETKRLPPAREILIAGRPVRLLHRVETPAFASMLYVMLSGDQE
ncbi:MAG: serine kinase [Silicimonas sp.]|nr:serine kinase [Silicimonas sp.]